MAAYDAEQEIYQEKEGFSVLSLMSMALLELGVIVEEDEI